MVGAKKSKRGRKSKKKVDDDVEFVCTLHPEREEGEKHVTAPREGDQPGTKPEEDDQLEQNKLRVSNM